MEKKDLFYKKTSAFDELTEETKNEVYSYAKGYAEFLDNCKTEREGVDYTREMLIKNGFVSYEFGDKVSVGGRYFFINRNKSIIAFTVGSKVLDNGIKIAASHIDSPRLDLKQHPIFEDNGIAYAKTHYYGGLRKYQWATIPLALHGAVALSTGEQINITIGENDGDPVFCITDLLPHLAKEQNQKTLATAFTGEGLNVMLCSTPDSVSENDKVKAFLLNLLYEKYSVTETDFISAELCFVPAGKAADIGIDRALIGGYGHDDRVCAYPSVTAMLENLDGDNSMMVILADKEETGSDGATGMQCRLFADIIDEIAPQFNLTSAYVRSKSQCLSADVAAAFDPNYSDVFEKNNSAIISCGVALSKYTGSGGKYSTNDCTCEFLGKIRKLFAENNILWQTAEMGKVDVGGGGTVAKYISRYNIDTVDIGVPVLSMHAPFEIISKYDLYCAHKAFSAFFNA